jgi:diguanylate cyclase (GGDEF)-like protein
MRGYRQSLRRRLLAAAFAVGAGSVLTAVPVGGQVVRNYGLEQGLSNLSVHCLAQDARGFLWAGTEDGLYRFSGREFQGFGQREGLPSSTVETLVATRDGQLWVGTPKGLACWNGLGFTPIPADSGLATGAIRALTLGPGGKVLVGTDEGLFEQVTGRRFRLVDDWPGGGVTALWGREDSHEVWVAAWSQASSRVLRWAAGTWGAADANPGMAEERIDALAVDGQRHLWARTQKALWVADSAGGRFREMRDLLPPGGQPGVLQADAQGRVWVPTERGLIILENGAPRRLGRSEGLPSTLISTVLLDSEGSLWLGGVGVQRIPGAGMWEVHGVEQGMPSDLVWCVFRDRAGQLFAGTDRGLARATDAGWRVVPGTNAYQIRTAVQSADGSILMAGSPLVLRWDPRRGSLDRFGPEAGLEANGRIYRLALGHDGRLWVATDGGGLLCGEPEKSRWRFHREAIPGGSRGERFEDVWVDERGRVWACGERGLALLDGGGWKRITTRDGLRADHVSYVRGRADGSLVLAYFEPLGICRARYREGHFEVLEHPDALVPPDRTVYLIGEDSERNLWLGTGRGVDLLLASGGVDHFNHRDGLAGDDVNSMAFLAEPNGNVWIGTSSGLAHFNARAYRGGPPPPKPEILSCRLGGRLVSPAQGRIPAVAHRENTFEVQFAAPTYAREGTIRYQVRLLGLESEWHTTDGTPERFPKLGSGHYRFEVRARIGQGAWGPASTFRFEVLPAWWETWWARGIQVLVCASVVGLFVRMRIRTLRRRTRLLEEMVAARTRDLERANAALRDQSLSDPLTGLRNRRFLTVAMPDTVAQIRGDLRGSTLGRAERMAENVDIVFIMVDIDHFKTVNDHYGHTAGDCVIQEMAGILRGAIRDSDSVIRWGGEEFLIVARNVSRREATILVERIRSAVGLHPFRVGKDETVRRTCSQGFAFFPFIPENGDLFEWERVVDLADHCLLAAKRAGRDAWVGLHPTLEGNAADLKDRLPAEIGGLLREGQLEVKASVAKERLNWETHPG